MPFQKVPFGDVKAFNVVVEVPAGSQKKYEYDPNIDAVRLARVLYGDVKFPMNFGHVPQTVTDDEKLLYAFVMSTYPISTGTVVECRPVGILEVWENGRRGSRILAVPTHEHVFDAIQDIGDVPRERIAELEGFFKELPKIWNRDIQLRGMAGRDAAIRELLRISNS